MVLQYPTYSTSPTSIDNFIGSRNIIKWNYFPYGSSPALISMFHAQLDTLLEN